MSHLSPFRLSIPNLGTDIPGSGSNPKKRRKNVQSTMQTPPNVQDLLPPPLSGYGDTIVASNPFDDCPNSLSSMSNIRNPPPMGMGPNMAMGMHNMNMCRGMGGPQINMGASGMIPSPNSQMMGSPMMMSGPRVNGPMGPQMGPHMMSNATTSPIHSISGPTHSPMGGGGMPGMGNGSPMNGPMGPNGPMNGIGSQMNGPMGVDIGVNGPNGIIGSNMNNNMMMNPMSNFYSKPMPVTAGKVYPIDQPMVFNSQNPNAPPIYPCGVCHKEVHDNDQAIPCESGCNFWFHRGCTGLTEMAYQYLTTEVYAEWVCDKCLASKNIPLVKYKP